MKKRILFSLAIVIFLCSDLSAQQWLKDMYDPGINFFIVQQEFNGWQSQHSAEHPIPDSSEENITKELFDLYKRWEYDALPQAIATNGIRNGAFDTLQYNFLKAKMKNSSQRSSANWHYIGPEIPFFNSTEINNQGPVTPYKSKGRLDCLRFDPIDTNVMYVGAPVGGLWKTSDRGQTWNLLNTDHLPSIGISDIAINPINTQNIFIATGDYAHSDSYSTGVLETNDGGMTWNTTGFSYSISQHQEIYRILIDPIDTNILLLSCFNGIYRSINKGLTWTNVLNQNFVWDIEFKPQNPHVLYAVCYNRFYRSTDAGLTWSIQGSGLPGLSQSTLAVTPADTNCIYVLSYDSLGGPALFRSLDGGNSFIFRSDTNLFQGQGSYDLCLGISPLNRDVVVFGSVGSGYSTDGGATFNTPPPTSNVHPDHRQMMFAPNSGQTVYSIDDGGLSLSSDTSKNWITLNNNLDIGQIYSTSSSHHDPDFFLTARQDCGTLKHQLGIDTFICGGDGTTCVIDPYYDSIIYYSTQYGYIFRSTQGGSVTGFNFVPMVSSYGTGVNSFGLFKTPFLLNPQNHNSIYVGKDSLYKSADAGSTWTALNTPQLNGSYISTINVAPSDSNFIYFANFYKIYGSANGGTSFSDITSGLYPPVYAIATSYHNPSEVWAASGTVYHSINGGQNWINDSAGLPAGFRVASLVILKNSPNAVYAGLFDGGGVYYKDSTMTRWMPYDNGLPNVTVRDLDIDYASGKIHAATFGRDIWEADLNNTWYNKPVAYFQHLQQNCLNAPVQYNDLSAFNATSWHWSFPGGLPSASNTQNPTVHYGQSGTYSAMLIATNAYGSDTLTQDIVVSVVSPSVAIPPIKNICHGMPVIFSAVTFNVDSIIQFQWEKNGSHVGINSSIYIDSALNNNDSIHATIILINCSANDTIYSNIVTIHLYDTINSQLSAFPCQGDTLSFLSNQCLSGIDWFLNGSPLIQTDPAISPNASTVAGSNGAGNNANQLFTPSTVFMDAQHNIYINDAANNRIQEFPSGSTSTTNGITVAGGNGQGSAANQLDNPYWICSDFAGNIYVSDNNNNRVQKWTPGATSGITVAGGNGPGNATNQLNSPAGIYVDPYGNLYVADANNDRVQEFPAGSTSATNGVTIAGGNGNGSAANQFAGPSGVCVDGYGNLYVADENNSRIQKFPFGSTSSTNGVTVAGGNGQGNAQNQFIYPWSVYVDVFGNIYIADAGNNRIQKWSQGSNTGVTIAGSSVGASGSANNQLSSPYSVFIDDSLNIYVADGSNNRVQKFREYLNTKYKTLVPGTYTAEATSVNGCATTSNSMTILSSPAPVITRTNNILSSNMAYGNQWIKNGSPIAGATSQSYTVTSSGWYYTEVTDTNGCSGKSDSILITLSGLGVIDLIRMIEVVPNPFKSQFSVKINGDVTDFNNFEYNLTDDLGRSISKYKNVEQITNIKMDGEAMGVYLLHVTYEKENATFKLIKQD